MRSPSLPGRVRDNSSRKDCLHLMFILGFSVPLLAWVSPALLLLLALAVAVVFRTKIQSKFVAAWAPFLIVIGGSVIAQIVILRKDGLPALFSLQFRDLGHAIDYLDVASPEWLFAAVLFFQFLLLPVIGSIFSDAPRLRQKFEHGLLTGLWCSLIVTAAQIAARYLEFELSEVFPNQRSFWSGINRLTGTFSDPNAFGVSIALVLPFLFRRFSITRGIGNHRKTFEAGTLFLGWLAAGTFSGSRTFFIAIALYLFMWALRSSPKTLIIVLTGFLGIVIAANSPQSAVLIEALPEGARRTAQALRLENMSVAFASRAVFFRLNQEMIDAHPLVGVGFGRFRDYVVPLAASAGLNTGVWTDNTNNFYLGLIAECGIIGLVTFLVMMLQYRFRSDAPLWSKDAIGVLLILLFFGPHIESVEVAVIATWLLGTALQRKSDNEPMRANWAAISFCFLPLIFLQSTLLPAGWSSWEREGTRTFRWTTGNARTLLKCGVRGSEFQVRALNPDIDRRPMMARITAPKFERYLKFDNREWVPFEIPCQPGQTEQRVRIETSRRWSPRNRQERGDPRFFGVQIGMDPRMQG